MDYRTRNGWTIAFTRNVHMYYHRLHARKGDLSFDVPCEDSPYRYTGIWPCQLKLDAGVYENLLDALREWARQSDLDYRLYRTPEDYESAGGDAREMPPAPRRARRPDPKLVDMGPQDGDLTQFFGARFHQDWMFESDSWQEVVQRFAAESGAAQSSLVADKIEALLASAVDDQRLCDIVQAMGSYYWTGSAAEVREWLIQVVDVLRGQDGAGSAG